MGDRRWSQITLTTPLHDKSEKLISAKSLMAANEILDTRLLFLIVYLHLKEPLLEWLPNPKKDSNADSFKHSEPLALVSH